MEGLEPDLIRSTKGLSIPPQDQSRFMTKDEHTMIHFTFTVQGLIRRPENDLEKTGRVPSQCDEMPKEYLQMIGHHFGIFRRLPGIAYPFKKDSTLHDFFYLVYVDETRTRYVYEGIVFIDCRRKVDKKFYDVYFRMQPQEIHATLNAIPSVTSLANLSTNKLSRTSDLRAKDNENFKFLDENELKEALIEAKKVRPGKKAKMECKYCDKSYANYPQMEVHLKSEHAKQVLYACFFCADTYTRHHSYHYHLCVHFEISKFVCKFCFEDHRHPNHFREHNAKAHNNCIDCDLVLGDAQKMSDHFWNVHGKDITGKRPKVAGPSKKNGEKPSTAFATRSGSGDNVGSIRLAVDLFNACNKVSPFVMQKIETIKKEYRDMITKGPLWSFSQKAPDSNEFLKVSVQLPVMPGVPIFGEPLLSEKDKVRLAQSLKSIPVKRKAPEETVTSESSQKGQIRIQGFAANNVLQSSLPNPGIRLQQPEYFQRPQQMTTNLPISVQRPVVTFPMTTVFVTPPVTATSNPSQTHRFYFHGPRLQNAPTSVVVLGDRNRPFSYPTPSPSPSPPNSSSSSTSAPAPGPSNQVAKVTPRLRGMHPKKQKEARVVYMNQY